MCVNEKKDKSLLLAMSIGDGYLHQGRYTTSLKITHSIKQQEYLRYKAEIVSKLIEQPVNVRLIDNNGYEGIQFSKGHKYFRILRKWLYINRKKVITRKLLNKLTLHGIAIWYMDDGSLYPKRKNGKIHAYELILSTYLSKEENQIIIDYFQEVWDIQFHQVKSKGSYRLRMNTTNIRKFIPLIKPFIIPSMSYKTASF